MLHCSSGDRLRIAPESDVRHPERLAVHHHHSSSFFSSSSSPQHQPVYGPAQRKQRRSALVRTTLPFHGPLTRKDVQRGMDAARETTSARDASERLTVDARIAAREAKAVAVQHKLSQLARQDEAMQARLAESKQQADDLQSRLHTKEQQLEKAQLALERLQQSLVLLCVVCQERGRNILLNPCRHVALCAHCRPRVSDCPMCRTVITGHTAVFL